MCKLSAQSSIWHRGSIRRFVYTQHFALAVFLASTSSWNLPHSLKPKRRICDAVAANASPSCNALILSVPQNARGSWNIEEEDSTTPLRIAEEIKPFEAPSQASSSIKFPENPQEVQSEIYIIDSAKLSEEIVLLASPTSASKETWRVRISPEYDIEVLPPIPHNGNDASTSQVRDSLQQRRSRFLDNVYPEIKDDLHSASRNSTNKDPVPSVLDMEWDFAQYDLDITSGTVGTTAEESSSIEGSELGVQDLENLPDSGLGLVFPPLSLERETRDEEMHGTVGVAENWHAEESSMDSDVDASTPFSCSELATGTPSILSTAHLPGSPSSLQSSLRPTDDVASSASEARHVKETADDRLMLTPSSLVDAALPIFADHDDDSESLGSVILRPATASIMSEDGEAEGQDNPEADDTFHPATASIIYQDDEAKEGQSDLESDDESTGSTILRPVTASIISEDDEANEGQGDPEPDVSGSLGLRILRPGTASVISEDDEAEGQDDLELEDSEGLGSVIIRPASASVLYEDGETKDGQDAPETNEYPVLTPLSLDDISLSLDWEVIPDLPSSPSSTDSRSAVGSSPLVPGPEHPQSTGSPIPGLVSDGVAEEVGAPTEPLQLDDHPSPSSAVEPEAIGSTVPDDLISDVVEEAGASLEQLGSIDGQSEDEWIRLPPLHFPSPSLTDELLSSPQFHTAAFHQESSPGSTPAVPRSRHVRALSTSQAERTSILWAPQDSRYQYPQDYTRGGNGEGKGKGRARLRARTVSDDSGFGEPSGASTARRVEQEVQTEEEVQTASKLQAKYIRLKKELKHEKAKAADLARRKDSDKREWSQYLWGLPSNFEDDIA
ncbi:hypothetical protein C8R44DRAFT_973270 [Mycena epipterygia]|nr:hypothetical protein C8R44DRAFT_973270 [Mycena epipterygia]